MHLLTRPVSSGPLDLFLFYKVHSEIVKKYDASIPYYSINLN